MDIVIQIVGSFVLFLNKIFFLKRNNFGWVLGIIGISILIYPLYQKQLFISVVLYVGLIILMIYGYLLTLKIKKQISTFWKFFFRIIIISMTLGLCLYIYLETRDSETFTDWQLGQAIGALFGFLLLAFNTRTSNIFGWIANIFSHSCATYVMHSSGLDIMAFFQILSALVSFKAIQNELKIT